MSYESDYESGSSGFAKLSDAVRDLVLDVGVEASEGWSLTVWANLDVTHVGLG